MKIQKLSKLWCTLVLITLLCVGGAAADAHVEVPIPEPGPTTSFTLQVSGANQQENVATKTVTWTMGSLAGLPSYY